MRASTVRGLTPEELRDRFALPFLPTNITNVLIPAGTCLLSGIAGPILGNFPATPPAIPTSGPWGAGGAQQTRVIGVDTSAAGDCWTTAFVPASDYINRRAIGANALWHAPIVMTGNEYSHYDAYNTLDVLNDGTATALRPALRELAGENLASAGWIELTNADWFARTLSGHVRAVFATRDFAVPFASAVTSYAPAPALSEPDPGGAGARGRWWGAGGGLIGRTVGNEDRSGYKARSGQATVGYDWKAPSWLLGSAVAFESTDFTVDGPSNSNAITTLRGAGYGATEFAGLIFGGTSFLSWDHVSSTRVSRPSERPRSELTTPGRSPPRRKFRAPSRSGVGASSRCSE